MADTVRVVLNMKPEDRLLLEKLARHQERTMTAAIVVAVRDAARKEGLLE